MLEWSCQPTTQKPFYRRHKALLHRGVAEHPKGGLALFPANTSTVSYLTFTALVPIYPPMLMGSSSTYCSLEQFCFHQFVSVLYKITEAIIGRSLGNIGRLKPAMTPQEVCLETFVILKLGPCRLI